MLTILQNYASPTNPHPAARANLQKIVQFMRAEGATTADHPISLMRIANGTGISYTQVRSLTHRPGFIWVVIPNKSSTGIFYDVKSLGLDYPFDLNLGRTYPSVAMLEGDPNTIISATEPTVEPTNNKGVGKVISQLLKPGQFIAETNVQAPHVFPNSQAFMSATAPILEALITGKRTPEQIAGTFHGLAVGFANGTLSIGENDA